MADDRNNGTGTSIPGTGTSIPGTGTSIPGTGTSIPGTGTSVPGTGTAVPGSATSAAGSAGSGNKGKAAEIPLLEKYIINGIVYKVNSTESSKTLKHHTGEARVVVVENGGRLLALKIYIPNHGPDHSVIEKIKQAKGGFVIRIHDHGKWTDPATGKTFDYEIMDYLGNGSLTDVFLRNDEKRFREIAMRMAFAIRQSHENGIIHRDVKPENFLFTDSSKNNFVLIDFGIARPTDGVKPVKVDAAKSSYFVSPEGAISSNDRTTYVGTATDYYSMGMSLLALLYGEKNFYSMYPVNDLGKLDMQKRNNTVVKEARRNGLKISDRMAELLEALLEVSDGKRAGFAEVEKWYKGESIGKDTGDTASNTNFRVVFDETRNLVARTRQELARMMLADTEFAKKYLYRGLAKNALQGVLPTLAMEIEDITQTVYPRAEEQDAGVYAVVLLLDPSIKYTAINGKEIDRISDIGEEIWKNHNTYSIRLANKTDRLWVYLNARGDDKVKALMGKYQPMIKQSKSHGIYALARVLNPDLNYYLDFKTGKKITDKEELAKELWNDKARYVSELRDINHSVYTWLKGQGWDDAKVKKTADNIRDKGEYELYDLCLTINLNFPLYDHVGKPMTTLDEVSEEFKNHYLDNPGEMMNRSHPLWKWLWIRSRGAGEIIKKYQPAIKEDDNTALWEIYYRLGVGPMPFLVQRQSDKGWYYTYHTEGFLEILRDHGITEESMKKVSTELFATWLTVNEDDEDTKLGVLLGEMIKKGGGGTVQKSYEYLYRLFPEISINFYTDKKSDMYIGTPAQLGRALNDERDPGVSLTFLYYGLSGNMQRNLWDIPTFRTSQLYTYMKVRKMDSYINNIEKLLDIDANVKAHPSAPYNWYVALWKIIQMLGHKPQYTYKDCDNDDGVATSPADVARRSYASNKKQPVNDIYPFISLFYHENVISAFSFSKLEQYYKFIKQNFPSSEIAERGEKAEFKVYGAKQKRDKAWNSLKRIRNISMWICMPVMLAIVGWICYLIGTDGVGTVSEAIESTGDFVKGLLAIVGLLLGLSGGLAGAVAGAILGYLVGWLVIWLLSALAAYILVILLLGVAIWCAWKLKTATTDTNIPTKARYDGLVDQCDVYVVTKALGTDGRVFGSGSISPDVVFNKSAQEAQNYKKQARKALWIMITTTLVTIGLGALIIDRTDSISMSSNQNEIPFDRIPGEYTGTFHERPATMILENNGLTYYGDLALTGKVTIQYSTPMVQDVVGVFDGSSLILSVLENESADTGISYNGFVQYSPSDRMLIYEGNYVNETKGTSHDFRFARSLDGKAIEENVQSSRNSKTDTGASQNATSGIKNGATDGEASSRVETSSDQPASGADNNNVNIVEIPSLQGKLLYNNTSDDEVEEDYEDPYFPGGDAMMEKWINENINYPADARAAGIQGRVDVWFVLTKEGKVTHPSVTRSVHPSLDAEALRIIRNMPTWTPGIANGEPVEVDVTIPVIFKL